MFDYFICALQLAKSDLKLKKNLISNFLRFCTFITDEKNIVAIVEKYKRPPKDLTPISK